MESIYQLKGYSDRQDYLECMSEDYGVPLETVLTIADIYGATEDFDGLVSALVDAEY